MYVQYAEILNVKAVVGLHIITTMFRRTEKRDMQMGLESSHFWKYTSFANDEVEDRYKI